MAFNCLLFLISLLGHCFIYKVFIPRLFANNNQTSLSIAMF